MADERGTSAKQEAELDRELEDTFPGSDPLQVTRAPRGQEFTPAKPASKEAPDEPPAEVVPPVSDLKW